MMLVDDAVQRNSMSSLLSEMDVDDMPESSMLKSISSGPFEILILIYVLFDSD